ncbi:MAG: hypothetical protein PHI29_09105 [Gallionella sp.]|nr:hypothetical protein [Gallionella sp.]
MALTQQEIDAFNQVKSSVAAIQAQYDAVCVEIATTENQLSDFPLLPVPIADLKAAILDFVDARGQAYLAEYIRPSIQQFATNQMAGGSVDLHSIGKPILFRDLENAINGVSGASSNAQLITAFDKFQFNDLALYAFFGALVKAGLTSAMAGMVDADFGYDGLLPEQIGTDRVTRRAAIQAAQDTLSALQVSKSALADNLRQLGVVVKG